MGDYVFIWPRTRTVSRTQSAASPRLIHVEQGIVLSHLTLREAQVVQLRGRRWVSLRLGRGLVWSSGEGILQSTYRVCQLTLTHCL